MLKLYVETIHRLGQSTKFNSKKTSPRKDEKGFASAETIALAVAGVVIVGLALAYFRGNIDSWLNNITGDINAF